VKSAAEGSVPTQVLTIRQYASATYNIGVNFTPDMLNSIPECPLLGAKRTLTNRCLPISIYEFTPLRGTPSKSVPRPSGIALSESLVPCDLAPDAKGRGVCPMSESAMKRCSLGALLMAAYEITKDHRAAYDLAIRAMQPLHGSATLMHVNGSRGHAAVLALFDEVIGAGWARL